MSRGRPIVEAMLNRNLPYTSGPQWLADNILPGRWVLAVSGTHGKTTTASMLAWILEYAGLNPGFLIGGVAENFGVSARLGETPFFVVEADEYDTAFFDKRSKFVHYRPRTLIINNLEYDHADIFPDLAAIQRQFHHLLRMVPGEGLVICPATDKNIEETLAMGCWTPVETLADESFADWHFAAVNADYSRFEIFHGEQSAGIVDWSLLGKHNASNALTALLAARHAGVPMEAGIAALAAFKGVKRRLELRAEINGVRVYDDFAHHPTAIRTTLDGLRAKVGNERIIVVFEPRSNTMRMGVHRDTLGQAFTAADTLWLYAASDLGWDVSAMKTSIPCSIRDAIDPIVAEVSRQARSGDHILVMSNGGFGGLHQKLIDALNKQMNMS
jgi:UDP-N-acetylmuramate: L-alanyl-gamma-D-glutamyl-meso-diaminopimelate ligase